MTTNPKQQKKKRQHYVPRFYLTYFVDAQKKSHEEDFLWVFEPPFQHAFRKAPKNIGFENYFYSFKVNNEYIYTIEDMLSKIESDVKTVFEELIAGTCDFQSVHQREIFATFVCLMSCRTVKSREHHRIIYQNIAKTEIVKHINQEGFQSLYKRFLHETGKSFDEHAIPDEAEFLESFNKIKVIPAKEEFLDMMLSTPRDMIPYLYQRKWGLLVPETGSHVFITSDNPVLLWNEHNTNPHFIPGLGERETDIIFPITPQLCLFASHDVQEGRQTTCIHDIVWINKRIANNCHKYVFSNTNKFAHIFSEN